MVPGAMAPGTSDWPEAALSQRPVRWADGGPADSRTRQPVQLQPLVPPQVLHFMQVPLRTSV